MKTLVALVALGLASQSLAARERPQAVAPDVSGTYRSGAKAAHAAYCLWIAGDS